MFAVHFPGFRVTDIDFADDRIRIDISRQDPAIPIKGMSTRCIATILAG